MHVPIYGRWAVAPMHAPVTAAIAVTGEVVVEIRFEPLQHPGEVARTHPTSVSVR